MKLLLKGSNDKTDWYNILDNKGNLVIIDTEKLDEDIIDLHDNYELVIQYQYIRFVKLDILKNDKL